jgi:hypothetical protein
MFARRKNHLRLCWRAPRANNVALLLLLLLTGKMQMTMTMLKSDCNKVAKLSRIVRWQ